MSVTNNLDNLGLGNPSPSSNVSTQVRLIETEFSDGYSQRIPDGVNNLRRVYNVVFENLNSSDSTTLRNWLTTYSQGETVVSLTHATDNVSRNWYIRDWDEQLSGPITRTFNFTLVEDR